MYCTLKRPLAVLNSKTNLAAIQVVEKCALSRLDLIRHSRVCKATPETSSRPAPGADANQRNSCALTIARLTDPRQHAGSQLPCWNPHQETQTPCVRPTSNPLPSVSMRRSLQMCRVLRRPASRHPPGGSSPADVTAISRHTPRSAPYDLTQLH